MAVGVSEAIRIWDIPSGTSPRAIANRGYWGSQALALSPDGRTVAACVDNSIGTWELDSGKPLLKDLLGHRSSAHFTACTPDGKLIITASAV